MDISLEQIQCLQAVSNSGSLSGASEKLNKAKSAVSYSIDKLEEQLGFPVLDRSGYRTRLTEQGQAFLTKAYPIYLASEHLKEDVKRIASGVETRMAISASAVYPSRRIYAVLKKLFDEFPATEIIFHREIMSGEKMLNQDMVDVAIFENLHNTLDFDAKKIGSVCLKLVVGWDHPFLHSTREEQTLENLTRYPQIIQRSTLPDDSSVGIPKKAKRWTVSDIDSKKELILGGLGWGRLPDHYVNEDIQSGRLIHLDHLNYDHSLDMFICKKKDKAIGPVLDYIWNHF
ncbi:MAG: LysR family transcriptional regulator [Bdellovibrionales bacterium]|nr:LysR family transcriptional regulator [Bdellovibrionales bacterium]